MSEGKKTLIRSRSWIWESGVFSPLGRRKPNDAKNRFANYAGEERSRARGTRADWGWTRSPRPARRTIEAEIFKGAWATGIAKRDGRTGIRGARGGQPAGRWAQRPRKFSKKPDGKAALFDKKGEAFSPETIPPTRAPPAGNSTWALPAGEKKRASESPWPPPESSTLGRFLSVVSTSRGLILAKSERYPRRPSRTRKKGRDGLPFAQPAVFFCQVGRGRFLALRGSGVGSCV